MHIRLSLKICSIRAKYLPLLRSNNVSPRMIDPQRLQSLKSIGFAAQEMPTPPDPALMLARITEQHRSRFVLSDGQIEYSAQAHPKLKQLAAHARPGVGDFVWLDARQQMFAHTLERTSALKRAAAGEKYAEQVLAANIDKVLIVCGLDRDFSVRRIERYLALVHGCNIEAAIVLSKADLHENRAQALADLKQRLGEIRVYAIDVRDATQAGHLKAELLPGQTGVLLGSSGAGKSTLSNTLSQFDAMRTGHVRASDGRGRHTTVHRALLRLDWGACLIDSPGLREIKLTGEEDIGAQTFADIESLSLSCRFRDCAHENEPDCAVHAAIASGQLSADRFANYKKLAHETAVAKKMKAADKTVQKRLRR
jgi:ribosome biogenesis GTPase / thiamine phosphate phosphatase